MLNLYDFVRKDLSLNKLEIGDFLFAEFTCSPGEQKISRWTHTDYLVNVVAGRKTWHTSDGKWVADPGETLFFKKGAAVFEQHFETEMCVLMCFIPDQLVRVTAREMASSLGPIPAGIAPMKSALRVENDVGLSTFFQSMHSYFSSPEKPSEPLLRLKMKELIVSILTSSRNPSLAAYFRTLGACDAPSVAEIMEENFRFNLSLEEYAQLCHRSLSSFKRDFQAHFQESPGKWLLRKRLEHSAALLRSSKMNITASALESGFEDVSHFSRAFKKQFGVSPMSYRQADQSI